MPFFKDPYTLLAEACSTDETETDDLYEDEVEDDLAKEYDDIEEMEDDLAYSADMVPVRAITDCKEQTTKYYVEAEDLAKLMTAEGLESPILAIDIISKFNNIEESAIYVVIESQDYANELIQEAKTAKKKTGSNKGLDKVASSTKLLKYLKTQGIKVVKKKSKGKKKKK